MKFIAHYKHRRNEKPDYYKTIWADSVNEAIKQAERWTRKNFICVGVTN